jgi:hypothetical protein
MTTLRILFHSSPLHLDSPTITSFYNFILSIAIAASGGEFIDLLHFDTSRYARHLAEGA